VEEEGEPTVLSGLIPSAMECEDDGMPSAIFPSMSTSMVSAEHKPRTLLLDNDGERWKGLGGGQREWEIVNG
jgi:hypothetical protein